MQSLARVKIAIWIDAYDSIAYPHCLRRKLDRGTT